MTRRRDIKKSDFNVVGALESSDYFDFVRNGQNLRISQVDLIAGLGTVGTIEAVGEATAVPVLEIVGGANYIRSILAGSGISAQVSPQNGIEVSHNFTADTSAVPVMVNALADSPVIRSIEAGTGINVSGSGNVIQVALSGVPATTKTTVINDISDFPAPVGDLITLSADTEYLIQSDISSVYRYAVGENTLVSGSDKKLISLEYTGVGTMITALDVNFKIKDIKLTCDSGTAFSVSSTTGLHVADIYNTNVSCNNVGNFDNLLSLAVTGSNFSPVYTQGFTFTGNFSIFSFVLSGLVIPSGTGNGFTLGTSTFTFLTITSAFLQVDTTGYVVSGLASSGNINAGGSGLISVSRNFGTADFSNNITPYDDLWKSSANSRLPDSKEVALSTHGGATIAIATAATPVIVGATWLSHKSYRFTSAVGGRWTYDGIETDVSVTASITADIATGTDNVSFFLYKNGVQIPESIVTREFTAGNVGNLSLLWDVSMVQNDYVELWVQNDDTNVDVIIVNAVMRIRS